MKTLFSAFLAILLVGVSAEASKKRTAKAAYKSSKLVHKKKTTKFKYNEKTALNVPFSFHDMGMNDAEFFISDRDPSIIQDEIDRVQISVSELEYSEQVSYEPKYMNQRPRNSKQKRAYLQGYLKVLEEGIM